MSPNTEGGGGVGWGGDIFTQYAKSLNQRVIMFLVSFNSDGSFEYPQHMFWLRNKKNNFQLCILIWGPDMVEISECEHYHDLINPYSFKSDCISQQIWGYLS